MTSPQRRVVGAVAGLGPAVAIMAYYLGTGGPLQPGILTFLVSPVVAGLLIGAPQTSTRQATILGAAGYMIAAYLVHSAFGIVTSLQEGRDLLGFTGALLEALGIGAFVTAIYFPFWAVVLSPLAIVWAVTARVLQSGTRPRRDTREGAEPREPRRRRSPMLLAAAAALLGYTLGFTMVAPSQCITTSTVGAATSEQDLSTTVCTSLIGMTYSGQGTFDPPRDLPIVVGLVLGALAFLLAMYVRRRGRRLDALASGSR
jgi:hypothetical protein